MQKEQFEYILKKQLHKCEDMLSIKGVEYSQDNDRLHNFHIAAEMLNIKPRAALAGMMAKHTVSVYDLCQEPVLATMGVWEEKITDHINYLMLLRVVVQEEMDQQEISAFDPTVEDALTAIEQPTS